MGWREDVGNFDLGRLTALGWLLFFLSLGAGVGVGFAAYTIMDSGLQLQPGGGPQRRSKLPYLAGFAGALGFFVASRFLLGLAGISLMRPPPQRTDGPPPGGGTNPQS